MRLIDAESYQFPGDLVDEPTIDAVPVVRCEQCKHRDWRQNLATGKVETICRHPCGLKHPGRDSFCSFGEGRDNTNGC